jgi:hypothetical protein
MSMSRAETMKDDTNSRRILVWDAPTRVFHWLMALSFCGAYLTTESERWRLINVGALVVTGAMLTLDSAASNLDNEMIRSASPGSASSIWASASSPCPRRRHDKLVLGVDGDTDWRLEPVLSFWLHTSSLATYLLVGYTPSLA